MYEKLSGMTGTADTEAVEFRKIYNLSVNVIPTNKPIRRTDEEDIVFKTENAKYKAIVVDIIERNKIGQPVLVGTTSIEKSETLSSFLKKDGVKHEVLNAKHHEREAELVAQAGRKGRITIATNMAGRGTDIVLGGNAEIMAKREIGNEDSSEFLELHAKYKPQCEAEKKDVLAAGGLYIIGTERHESRRIDNQLRGRSGRQGDPGGSKFYLSLEDNLMRIFNGERIQKIMNMLDIPEDEPITHRMVTNAIEGAQRKVEGHNFDIRKHLLDYDDVMNQQRTAIYKLRRQILEGKEIERTVLDMLGDVVSVMLDTFVPEGSKETEWNLEGLNNFSVQHFGYKIDFTENTSLEKIQNTISENVKRIFESQKRAMGPFFERVCTMIMLTAIDQRWKEHLYRIDKVKEGINLRAYGQKDPLIEYKKEAFREFEVLNNIIKNETVEKIMRVQLVQESAQQALESLRPEEQNLNELNYAGAEESKSAFSQRPPVQQGGMEQLDTDDRSPAKRRLIGGPGSQDDRQMNRAQRRRQGKK